MARRRGFRFRVFTAVFLAAGGTVLALTGIVCYIKPPTRVAVWIGWRFLGVEMGTWEALHTVFALLFVLAAVTHVVLNRKALWNYLRGRLEAGRAHRRETATAILFAVVFVLLTFLGTFPVQPIMTFRDRITEGWGKGDGTPPIARIERYSLDTFCRLLELDLERTIARLEAAGYRGVAPHTKVRDIAALNGVPPREIGRLLSVRVVE
jgi:hypothetical protein